MADLAQTESPLQTRGADEIKRFEGLWRGGYFEGDPLDPLSRSTYFQMGFISILHAIYQACVKPYITPDTVVLEIGPGRGAWTKTMLPAKEIWCLDALSADHNGFWPYVGEEHRSKIRYIQVTDFLCRDLPDNHFDFLFSFGTFCHIPWEQQRQYYENLFRKMRPGATGFVMFADHDKFNGALKTYRNLRIHFQPFRRNVTFSTFIELSRRLRDKFLGRETWLGYAGFKELSEADKKNTSPTSRMWRHADTAATRQFLESIGWEVVTEDIGLCPRDPIVQFRKPAASR